MATTEKIRPDGLDVDNANYTASAGTKYGATSDELDSTFIESGIATQAITFTLSDLIVAGNTAAVRVVVHGRFSLDGSGQVGLRARFGGVDVDQARVSLNAATGRETSELEFEVTFLRPGGGQWLIDDINNLNAGISDINWTTNPPRLLELWVEVTYAETPSQLPAPREVASRILRQNRTQRDTMTGKVPPEFLDLELLTDFGVVHADASAEGGAGYQLEKWKRGLFRLESIEVDMNAEIGDGLIYTISGTDLREYAVNLWDDGRALSAGPLQDGAALLDGGQARTFTRGSPAYVNDPSDARVVGVQYDLEAIARRGIYIGRLLEGASKNYLHYSSFADGGGAGTLPVGAIGYNGSAIDFVEYTDWSQTELFDPNVSRYYVRFTGWTSGSPASDHLMVRWEASDIVPAGTDLYLSIDRRHLGGSSGHAELVVALQRSFDSLYYQWDGTWGAAVALSTVAPTSAAVVNRYSSFGVIPSGANDSTFVLRIGFEKTLPNNKVAYLYHVQLEENPWASSRIVTGAAGVTRSAALLSYENPQANRIWSADRGGFSCKVLPDWSEPVIGAGAFKTLAFCYHNANNYALIAWDKDGAQWIFQVVVGGVSAQAFKSTSGTPVSNAVPTAIAARWTSSVGELGLTAYTLSIFVDGVKGTDAVAAGPMVELDASDGVGAGLYLGSKNGIYFLDGIVWDVEIVPFVQTDDEIARRAL